jgi:hypothetical protein
VKTREERRRMRNLLKTLAVLFFLSLSFTLDLRGIPSELKVFFKNLPPSASVKVENFGSGFKAVVDVQTPSGKSYTEIISDSFLGLCAQLYKVFNLKVENVSLKLLKGGKSIPYNPFYAVWVNDVKLVGFSHLRPGCTAKVVRLKVKSVRGAKIEIDPSEVKKFLQNGVLKYPVRYCP